MHVTQNKCLWKHKNQGGTAELSSLYRCGMEVFFMSAHVTVDMIITWNGGYYERKIRSNTGRSH